MLSPNTSIWDTEKEGLNVNVSSCDSTVYVIETLCILDTGMQLKTGYRCCDFVRECVGLCALAYTNDECTPDLLNYITAHHIYHASQQKRKLVVAISRS